jgi:hypothetical protein
MNGRRIGTDVDPSGRRDSAGFVDLVERLIGGVARLLNQSFALLTLELKEELAGAVRNLVVLMIGGMLAMLGMLLLSIAAALWIGTAVGSLPGGYGIVGGALALSGAGVLTLAGARLRKQRVVPQETIQELRRDVKWLKNEQ